MHDLLAMFFLCCYWKFKLPHCLWLIAAHIRDLYLSYRINKECRCFHSEHESDNPNTRVFSRVCVNECTTQTPFSNKKLCCFHIRQGVRVGTVDPISVNTKWASDTFAYRNLSQKPFGYPLGIYVLQREARYRFHPTKIFDNFLTLYQWAPTTKWAETV